MTPNKNKPLTHSSNVSNCLGLALFHPPLNCPTSVLFLAFWLLNSQFGPELPVLCSPPRPALTLGHSVHGSSKPPPGPSWALGFSRTSWKNSSYSPGLVIRKSLINQIVLLLSQNAYLAQNSILDTNFCFLDNVPSSLQVYLACKRVLRAVHLFRTVRKLLAISYSYSIGNILSILLLSPIFMKITLQCLV